MIFPICTRLYSGEKPGPQIPSAAVKKKHPSIKIVGHDLSLSYSSPGMKRTVFSETWLKQSAGVL
jgi:hypothetical protein